MVHAMLVVLWFLLLSSMWLVVFGNSDGLVEHSLEHDGLVRWFLEKQPNSFQSDGTAALVLLLHGGTEDMYSNFMESRHGSRRWLHLSEQHGFLLLAPNAVGTGMFGRTRTKGRSHWNDLRNSPTTGDQDDVGFLVKVIDWAVTERSINPKKVYFTGASNGGMMTYRMAIERPDVMAAGAALIANLPGDDVAFDDPDIAIPLFIMNGDEDPIMPFEGGEVRGNGGLVRSSAATRDYFVQVNGANPVPIKTTLPDANPDDGCIITSEFYSSDTAPVEYLVMMGAGHVYATTTGLPWLLQNIYRLVVGPGCRDAESADLAWEFLTGWPSD